MSSDELTTGSAPLSSSSEVRLVALPPFKPEINHRAWASVPHPTLPLLATCHAKHATVYSLSTLSAHSIVSGGHSRSVRTASWKPGLPPQKLCLVTGSFDSTTALWRWDGDNNGNAAFDEPPADHDLAVEITSATVQQSSNAMIAGHDSDKSEKEDDWEFSLVLEGHESEVKSVTFSPGGQYLATCGRDKHVWIWEDVGATEADDEWETVAVLNEHDGDVKCVAWCPDVPGRGGKGRYSTDVLASSSYDDTVRIWREDGDGEWVCVAVLEGHEGTVWGVQWEPDANRDKFPRLMTFSADKTIRIWTLKEDDEDEAGTGNGASGNPLFRAGFGGIPNTMRRSLREEWECTALLPTAHTRDIYSAAWSATSGLVASTGCDGVIALYREDPEPNSSTETPAEDATMTGPSTTEVPSITANGDAELSTNGNGHHHPPAPTTPDGTPASSNRWRLLTSIKNAHGPYEINHITWCKRFDSGCEDRGVEEMLVTTADGGAVKPWQVVL